MTYLRPHSALADPTDPEPVVDWSSVDGWYTVEEPTVAGRRLARVAVRVHGSRCGTDLVPTEVEYTSHAGRVYRLPCTAWCRRGSHGTGTRARVADALAAWVESMWADVEAWADERAGAV